MMFLSGLQLTTPVFIPTLLKHPEVTQEKWKAFKSLEAYNYYQSGWVRAVFYHDLGHENKHCFLKALVNPSQRLSEKPHQPWVVEQLLQLTVLVWLVLFKVEACVRLGKESVTCMSLPCTWNQAFSTKINPALVVDIDFNRPKRLKPTTLQKADNYNDQLQLDRRFSSTQALIGMFQPLNGVLNTSKKQEAREAYANIMAVKHATFKVNPAGLRVCTRQPFLAAVVVKRSVMERELLKYSAESMDAALKEVREGRMTCFAASKTFSVPRSTLRDKLSGRSPEGRQMGPNPVLTRAEEASLTTFCIKLLKCGFPINRDDLLDIVQKVVKEDKRKTPFTDDRPGGRATVTEAHIRKWFADIETYRVEEERAGDVLLDPHRVFNFDESHFLLAKKRGTVLGPVNYNNFLEVSKENDKEGLTVLIGYSANGSLAPPMIVYSYKQNIPCESVGSVDPSWALGSEAFLGLLKAAPYLITLLSNVVLQSIFHALCNIEIQGGGEHSNQTWRETNRTGDYTRNPLNWIKQCFPKYEACFLNKRSASNIE
ncbi:hypothetical protein EMCRGX_G029757 [Ephydatia muelleri]